MNHPNVAIPSLFAGVSRAFEPEIKIGLRMVFWGLPKKKQAQATLKILKIVQFNLGPAKTYSLRGTLWTCAIDNLGTVTDNYTTKKAP